MKNSNKNLNFIILLVNFLFFILMYEGSLTKSIELDNSSEASYSLSEQSLYNLSLKGDVWSGYRYLDISRILRFHQSNFKPKRISYNSKSNLSFLMQSPELHSSTLRE